MYTYRSSKKGSHGGEIFLNATCIMMSYLMSIIFLNNLYKFHGDLINFTEISNDDVFKLLIHPVTIARESCTFLKKLW